MSHTHIIILGMLRFTVFGRVLVYVEGGSFLLERERFMGEVHDGGGEVHVGGGRFLLKEGEVHRGGL